MIYLDYSATTPVDEEVINTFMKVTKDYIGNPNSLHKLGIEAKRLMDASTEQIAKILGVKTTEIIYTSGASESNNTAIKGICFRYQNRGKHIITTRLEHSSVIAPLNYLQTLGFEVDFVELDENGRVDLNDLENKLRDDTLLVSIGSINSEVGIIQPINEIAKLVEKYPKTFFHSDMTQHFGKENVDLTKIDLISFSAQKFYGVKGVGCLVKKENIMIDPLIHGGKSTTAFRSGTPALPLIASTAKALRIAVKDLDQKHKKVEELNTYLKNKLKEEDIYINSNKYCTPFILNISLKNIKSETMLHALEMKDIYISTQTACSKGETSIPVYAVTKDENKAKHSLRISLSYLTTKEEIDGFVEVFHLKLEELRKLYESN